ncbi:DUF3173 domain-containing protein [Lactococcus garvieae subsp. garvieae]|uniref:DUF3173 family protein n=1 Tax=Lactococcus garvieae TaxID=1363 RepID=UPI0005A85BFD|nr:DUF3173 family protein [Lactococcus garvieae]KAA8713672.1 DUF3173 domain-containing protein [Lactococcus garvieae subsp. garvieae]MDG6190531.1 DUF3173 domain-containing protein [Lactococcus garvieae]PCS03803.1 hypothetical protein RU85_GL000140 [Lactococcus garvieae]QPR48413.1 DUF3173 family protein [Lactococcus garvieae]
MQKTVNYVDLMKIGFPEHTSRTIIQQAKKLAVIEYENEIKRSGKNKEKMVKYPCSPFANRRLGVAPRKIIEELLGFSLLDESEEIK